MNARVDRRRVRRPLNEKEALALLIKTKSQPKRGGLSGPVRSLLYRLALESGLRAGEIKSLRVSSFEGLNGKEPTVRISAADSKHRREDLLPLRTTTAAKLAQHFARLKPWNAAFELPPAWRPAEDLRHDLAAAKIDAVDESGRAVDFHALRVTFCTMLARANVPPKIAQALARHSSFAMTFDLYAKIGPEEEARALQSLPDFDGKPDQEAQATGTDDQKDWASCWASAPAEPCIPVPLDAPDDAANPKDTLVGVGIGSGGGT